MFSLIVATLNRVTELDRFLVSLEEQSYRDFEVVVVDQNPDDRLVPMLALHPRLAIRHLRSERGLARARNVGLRAARGDIIAVPDDDCWYSEDCLMRVSEWFERFPEYSLLSTCSRDEAGVEVASRWPRQSCGHS